MFFLRSAGGKFNAARHEPGIRSKPMNPRFSVFAAECLGLAMLFAAGYMALLIG